MPEPLPPDVVAAMRASNKIEAIRLLRTRTGLGLAEAKEAVEVGYIKSSSHAKQPLPTELPIEAITALRRGSKIDAIQIVRRKFGIGLKDAKEVVDAAEHSYKAGTSPLKGTLAPGEVPLRQTGIAVFLLLVVVVAVGAWWVFSRS